MKAINKWGELLHIPNRIGKHELHKSKTNASKQTKFIPKLTFKFQNSLYLPRGTITAAYNIYII